GNRKCHVLYFAILFLTGLPNPHEKWSINFELLFCENCEDLHCDHNIDWQAWYRLKLGQSSARIPERCIDSNRCGTHAPLWITQPHPTQVGEIVDRAVCGTWTTGCCHFRSYTIQVKLCYGNYYVYKLQNPAGCYLAYCAGIIILLTITTLDQILIYHVFLKFTCSQQWLQHECSTCIYF
uniref:UMOD/GP2/OIT3-like D8C domain-containing protein n=1 Tax=Neolamprologus brichardi TaxID=32507 RepID=A0A3Q4GDI7_NEOBR